MSHGYLVKIPLNRRNAQKSEPKADPKEVVFTTEDVTNSRLQPLLEPVVSLLPQILKKKKRMKINVVTLLVGNCFYHAF